MSDNEARLGGRLPILDEAGLSDAQTALWTRMDATTGGSFASKAGFVSKTTDGRFIGPFNPMLRSPEIAATFLQLQIDEATHSSLSERVRQVVILSVGSVWKASYELYAHSAAARHAGFSDACVDALASGADSVELADDEALAQRLALTLVTKRVVGDDLYCEAQEQFGDKGLVDFAILVGCYQLVCGLLKLFAIPSP